MRTQVSIIGTGPAGLTAAIFSAGSGRQTTVVEANTNPGRKLLLTGGGRCNITHQAEPRELARAFGSKGKFLSYSFYEFPPDYIRDFFARLGLQTKVEKDGCVFPLTEHAGDVRDALVENAKRHGVRFLYDKRVSDIAKQDDAFIVNMPSEQLHSEKLIIATGGLSWPQTGCTGDGYRFAGKLGHSIVKPKASLVPLVTFEKWPAQLAGTAVGDVHISTVINKNKISTSGAVVFTEDGIGGPAVQDMSWYLTDYLPIVDEPLNITLDLAPLVGQTELEKQIIESVNANPKKKVINVLMEFVPKRLSVFLCGRAGCDDELPAGQLQKDVRKKLVADMKALPLSILRTRPIEEATVTRGGVAVDEIDPKTMESLVCPDLYFAGEVLDADGPCGGYNLQMCFSTGALAGTSAAQV